MPLRRLMHEVPLLNHLCKPGLCSCIFEVGINFKMRGFIYFKIKVLVLQFITAEVLAVVVKLKVIIKSELQIDALVLRVRSCSTYLSFLSYKVSCTNNEPFIAANKVALLLK